MSCRFYALHVHFVLRQGQRRSRDTDVVVLVVVEIVCCALFFLWFVRSFAFAFSYSFLACIEWTRLSQFLPIVRRAITMPSLAKFIFGIRVERFPFDGVDTARESSAGPFKMLNKNKSISSSHTQNDDDDNDNAVDGSKATTRKWRDRVRARGDGAKIKTWKVFSHDIFFGTSISCAYQMNETRAVAAKTFFVFFLFYNFVVACRLFSLSFSLSLVRISIFRLMCKRW